MEDADCIASRKELPETMRVNSLGPAGTGGGGGAAAEGCAVNTRVAPSRPDGIAVVGANGGGGAAGAADVAGVGALAGTLAEAEGADGEAPATSGAPKMRVNAPGSRRTGTASNFFSGVVGLMGDSNSLVKLPASFLEGGGTVGSGVGGAWLGPVGLNGELKNLVKSPPPGTACSSPSTSDGAGDELGGAEGEGGEMVVAAGGGAGVGFGAAAGLVNSFVNWPVGRVAGSDSSAPWRICIAGLKERVNSPGGRPCDAVGLTGGTGVGDAAFPPKIPVDSPAGNEDGAPGAARGAGTTGSAALGFPAWKMAVNSPAGCEDGDDGTGAEGFAPDPNISVNPLLVSAAGDADAGLAGATDFPNIFSKSELVPVDFAPDGVGDTGGAAACPNISANVSRGLRSSVGSEDPNTEVAGSAGAPGSREVRTCSAPV